MILLCPGDLVERHEKPSCGKKKSQEIGNVFTPYSAFCPGQVREVEMLFGSSSLDSLFSGRALTLCYNLWKANEKEEGPLAVVFLFFFFFIYRDATNNNYYF